MSDTTTPADHLGAQLAGLDTERIDDTRRDLDLLPTSDLVAGMIDGQRAVVRALEGAADDIRRAVDGIAERMARGGRLVYAGAGTSGRLGVLDASEIPPTFGTDPSLVVGVIAGGDAALRHAIENAEDDAEAGRTVVDELRMSPADVLVGLTASGRTPFVLGALDRAHDLGALTIAVSCNRPSVAGTHAEVAIDLATGPEFVAGSTRLAAGSAQKAVLNMLSTLAMVRLGKTYGNVMVDVRVTNAKLAARATRTVAEVTGASAEAARAALESADGSVKQAILQRERHLAPEEARALLAAHDGRLRAALDDSA